MVVRTGCAKPLQTDGGAKRRAEHGRETRSPPSRHLLSPDHKRAAVERLISVRTGTRTSTEQSAELAAVDNLLKINSLG